MSLVRSNTQEESTAGGASDVPAPSPDDCRTQLDRILGSKAFTVTERNRRFLAYVVEETLAARADRIKAYTVAIEVFGRDSSFDPQADPIVRIEAAQLRRALEHYYLTDGLADPILITIPKGGYVPQFAVRSVAAETPAEAAPTESAVPAAVAPRPRRALGQVGWVAVALVAVLVAAALYFALPMSRGSTLIGPDIPRILVLPLEDLSEGEGSRGIARGLTEEIVGQLSKFRDLVVVETGPGGQLPSPGPDYGEPVPRFTLRGSFDMAGDRFRLQAKLTNTGDGSVLWADSYTGDLQVDRLLEIQADIAGQVATALGQPYGVIFQADLSRTVEDPGADWAAYSCTLQYYTYRVDLKARSHPAVRKCLEDAVARFPAYATAWALLSQVYVDEVRFRFAPSNSSARPPLERAFEAAGRAIELDPRNVRAAQAKMLALWFSGDFASALDLGAGAFKVNANDTELMGEYGYRLVLSPRWREGCPLVARARELSPGPAGYFETALALCAYREGRFDDALPWIRTNPTLANPNYHLIAAAIYAEAGLPDDASREVKWLVENAPGLVANIKAELAIRTADSELLRAFLASLAKAGMHHLG